MKVDFMEGPHRRLNCLTGEWIIVSAQRATRPWQGQIEKTPNAPRKEYDPECYLCPGNVRAEGRRNPDYQSTFVFDNDFPALLPNQPSAKLEHSSLLVAESESGNCRVVCFSPRHDLSIPQMDQASVRYRGRKYMVRPRAATVWATLYQVRSNLRKSWCPDGSE